MRIATTGLLLGLLLLGCAEAKKQEAPKSKEAVGQMEPPGRGGKGADEALAARNAKEEAAAEKPAGQGKPAQAPAPEEVKRKIIYTAQLDLVVEDMDEAQVRLDKALEEVGGYVARSEMRGAAGSRRDGNWTLRVQVGLFDSLRKSLLKLGIMTRNSVDSEDITDRFYDTEARMKTNQVEEEGLRKLYLDKANTSKLAAGK